MNQNVETDGAGFSDVFLVHNALPECNMDNIKLSTRFLGHKIESPLFIAAMTGGHPGTIEVNRRLARAAEKFGLGIGVGSQRAALEDPSLENTFSVVRDEAPDAFVVANIGIVQLRDHGLKWAERAIEMIDADAIAIHLNFLQEAVQPEGDHDGSGLVDALTDLTSSIDLPVIMKETGSGISYETAKRGLGAGVSAIETGGFGGTSWAVIERERAKERKSLGDDVRILLGETFSDWGIPTVMSLLEIAPLNCPLISTGGLRSGLDIAKSVAMGASLCGMALPLLRSAVKSESALEDKILQINKELKVAMFLTGSESINKLKSARTILTGKTLELTKRKKEE